MAKLKREWHYFVLTDYEQEEEYLRRKHQQGWKLIKVKLPGLYYFEECTPEDMVYRLDFNPQYKQDVERYLQLYQDYGWEYLQDMNEYSYFRKPAADLEEENQIFSDQASKLTMLKRIFRKRMLPILSVFLLCVLPGVRRIFTEQWYGVAGMIAWCVWAALFVLYLSLLLRCGVGFYRLGKKYNEK